MHAATKPQVLGLFLLLAAVGLQMRTWWVWPVLVVAWIFQLLTVPVSAHMVGRSGYRTKHLHRNCSAPMSWRPWSRRRPGPPACPDEGVRRAARDASVMPGSG